MREIHGDRGLRILTGSSLDSLLDRLADTMRDRPLPPLTDEIVIVQSQGMARWLSLRLADRLGVAGSLRMPFPAAFCRMLTGGRETPDRFETDALKFRLFRILGGAGEDRQLADAARYLAGDNDQRKRHQLARRIAACFDDYQLYRDDLLLGWEKGRSGAGEARWQAHLWRLLLRETMPERTSPTSRSPSKAAETAQGLLPFPQSAVSENAELQSPYRFQEVRALLEDPAAARTALPPRVSVFAPSTLPPAFVGLLERMAEHVPARLYLLRPAADPDRDRHPLAVAFGGQNRELAEVIEQHAPSATREDLPLADPGHGCLLHALQSDVLAGRSAERRLLRTDDDSLRIHACHSPMREMEVLRDQVLAALDADPALQPHDVLVLVPDIGIYAPYIEAAFRNAEIDLPFRVADRGLQAEEPVVAAFLRVLELAQGRLTAPDVLHLLEVDAVRARFRIQRSQLPALRAWVERTRIRWGVDGKDREQHFDVPGLDEHSWRHGLRRLVLGHATGRMDELVAGLAPSGECTDAHAELLGAFADFCETVFARLRSLARPHTLGRWRDLLLRLLEELFLPVNDDELAGIETTRAAVARLGDLEELSDLEEEVAPAVLREHLQQAFLAASHPHVFLGGGITFAALKPMRTIPVRMLCLAGMQDDAFPRRDRPASFDLIARHPRPGDRSARGDDRQLFLECLLAARDRLVITYVGRSQKDDSERAPSIVLDELLGHLEKSFTVEVGGRVRDAVTVAHPLQAFGRRYFDGSEPRLFSYAARNCPQPSEVRDELFAPEPIPAADPAPARENIDLTDLVDFWRDPSKYFCTRILELRLPRLDDREDDAEPFALHGLDRYRLQQDLCEELVRGTAEGAPYELLRQQGVLPAGELGRMLHARAVLEAATFVEHMPMEPGRDRGDGLVQGPDWTLHGTVVGLAGTRRVVWRYARLKPKDRLRAWIHHLFLNAAALEHPDLPRRTLQIARDDTVEWRPIEEPLEHLERLVNGFRQGRRRPLTFFEHSSPAYAEQLFKRERSRRRTSSPWHKAESAWYGNEYGFGGSDEENPYAVLCARDANLFRSRSSAFATWAQNVWLPILEEASRK